MSRIVVVSLGYQGVFIARNTKDFWEGEATFYRSSLFSLESSESLLLSDVINQVQSWKSWLFVYVYIL